MRRTTTDIDATFRAEGVDLEALVRRFARHGIRPRVSFEHEALSAPITIDFAGVQAPAARPEDLIIYKLFAGRPQDYKDAEALLLMHRKDIDLARVRKVLEHLAEMAEEPEIAHRLSTIDRPTRRAPKKRPPPRR